MRLRTIGVYLLFVPLLLAGQAARADAIDGAWCRDEGERLMISGPTIVTPAGTRAQGDYDRHHFSYVVPAGDPGAGGIVQMRLLSEELMQSRTGPDAPVVTWRRCGPPVS